MVTCWLDIFCHKQWSTFCIVSIEAWTMALVALVQFSMDTMQMHWKKHWMVFSWTHMYAFAKKGAPYVCSPISWDGWVPVNTYICFLMFMYSTLLYMQHSLMLISRSCWHSWNFGLCMFNHNILLPQGNQIIGCVAISMKKLICTVAHHTIIIQRNYI